MSSDDAERWDHRYEQATGVAEPGWPERFAAIADSLPFDGQALDLACGVGSIALYLAERGLSVLGVDVSTVAIDTATERAVALDLHDRATFRVIDLDAGLPATPPLDLITCHLFRDARLDRAIVERLKPGGLLAVAALSEVGAEPGPFRVKRGELVEAFGDDVSILDALEGDGVATVVGRRLPQPR